MESQHMLVTESATTEAHGYGQKADKNSHSYKLLRNWAEFYEMKISDHEYGFPSWGEVDSAMKIEKLKNNPPEKNNSENDQTIIPSDYKSPEWLKHFTEYKANPYTNLVYINHYIYKKRIEKIIVPFLWEANLRASEQRKKAYIHAIGLGLGVWQICPQQADWMFQVYKEILSNGDFDQIEVVDFSWFPDVSEKTNEIITGSGGKIEIRFSRRDPAEKLQPEGKYLLVAMYAWDGNSFPGNEYWRGMLHASGDPAAACCSTITELQNPEINKDFVKRIEWLPSKSKL